MGYWTRRVLILSALGAASAMVARRSGSRNRHRSPEGWQAVTVDLSPDRVLFHGDRPAPLDAFGEGLEIDTRSAPGNKGTEVRARLRDGGGRSQLREAMRDAKQLLEVGEVLHGPEPETARVTLLNLPFTTAERQAKRIGLL